MSPNPKSAALLAATLGMAGMVGTANAHPTAESLDRPTSLDQLRFSNRAGMQRTHVPVKRRQPKQGNTAGGRAKRLQVSDKSHHGHAAYLKRKANRKRRARAKFWKQMKRNINEFNRLRTQSDREKWMVEHDGG